MRFMFWYYCYRNLKPHFILAKQKLRYYLNALNILFVRIYAFAIIIYYRWSQNTYVSFQAVTQNWNWNDEKI